MFRRDRVAIHAAVSEFAVRRVKVEAVATGNERPRLGGVQAQFVGGARLSGIVAGGGNPAAERLTGPLEAADVVALPAMQRNGDRRKAPQGNSRVDAQRGVPFACEFVGGVNLWCGHLTRGGF